jgi:hypothetical protein
VTAASDAARWAGTHETGAALIALALGAAAVAVIHRRTTAASTPDPSVAAPPGGDTAAQAAQTDQASIGWINAIGAAQITNAAIASGAVRPAHVAATLGGPS